MQVERRMIRQRKEETADLLSKVHIFSRTAVRIWWHTAGRQSTLLIIRHIHIEKH
jgi:hypothetical protein